MPLEDATSKPKKISKQWQHLERRASLGSLCSSVDPRSWSRKRPGVPDGVPCNPNRLDHDQHLYEVNRFLKYVHQRPDVLMARVESKRQSHSDGQLNVLPQGTPPGVGMKPISSFPTPGIDDYLQV